MSRRAGPAGWATGTRATAGSSAGGATELGGRGRGRGREARAGARGTGARGATGPRGPPGTWAILPGRCGRMVGRLGEAVSHRAGEAGNRGAGRRQTGEVGGGEPGSRRGG